MSAVVEKCFCLYVFSSIATFQQFSWKKIEKVDVVWLQCHFVGELFSYLSVQIISNASANCFNVSTFSKQHDSFSANLQQLSVSVIYFFKLCSLFTGTVSLKKDNIMSASVFMRKLGEWSGEKAFGMGGKGIQAHAGWAFVSMNRKFFAEVSIPFHWRLHYPWIW